MVNRNKWVLIRNAYKYPELKNAISNDKLDAVVGFLYLDHERGLSIMVDGYFTDKAYLNIKDTLLILRHSAFSTFLVEDLSIPQQEIIKLPNIPDWVQTYEPDVLMELRNDNELDPFRHPSYADDVRVLLLQKNNTPQLVWFRVQKKLTEGYEATLLNTLESSIIKKGDSHVIKHKKIGDTTYLIALVEEN